MFYSAAGKFIAKEKEKESTMTNAIQAAIESGTMSYRYGPIVGPNTKPGWSKKHQRVDAKKRLLGISHREILFGPIKGVSGSNFDEVFLDFCENSPAETIAKLITQQISASDHTISGKHWTTWVNLTSIFLLRSDVREALLNVLTIRKDQWGDALMMRHFHVGLELTKHAKLDTDSVVWLQRLGNAGYKISIDDVGTAAHSDSEYLEYLCRELQPAKVKLDYDLVRGKTSIEVKRLVREWQHTLPQYYPMVIEGLPVCPQADRSPILPEEIGNPDIFLMSSRDAKRWRNLLRNLQEEFDVPFWGQLAPMEMGSR